MIDFSSGPKRLFSGSASSKTGGGNNASSRSKVYMHTPADHRAAYEIQEVTERILDAEDFLEFQQNTHRNLCAHAGFPDFRLG
ncbi:MAG: hypothetical protein WKF37_10275 [Bryobacteraceae bacterium]